MLGRQTHIQPLWFNESNERHRRDIQLSFEIRSTVILCYYITRHNCAFSPFCEPKSKIPETRINWKFNYIWISALVSEHVRSWWKYCIFTRLQWVGGTRSGCGTERKFTHELNLTEIDCVFEHLANLPLSLARLDEPSCAVYWPQDAWFGFHCHTMIQLDHSMALALASMWFPKPYSGAYSFVSVESLQFHTKIFILTKTLKLAIVDNFSEPQFHSVRTLTLTQNE